MTMPAKPRALRLLEGNPGRRPLPPPDPSTAPLGFPPPRFAGVRRLAWLRVKRECPWLRRGDRMLVETFCRSWVLMVTADDKLLDAVERGAPEKETRHLQSIVDKSRAACLLMFGKMGATAESRARMVGTDESHEETPAEAFFLSESARAGSGAARMAS